MQKVTPHLISSLGKISLIYIIRCGRVLLVPNSLLEDVQLSTLP